MDWLGQMREKQGRGAQVGIRVLLVGNWPS